MPVLYEYAIAAYFAYCRIFRMFQQIAHIAYFFRKKWHFRRRFKYYFVSITYFYYVSLPRPSGCQQNGTIRVSGPL